MSTLRKALSRIWAASPTAGILPVTDAKWREGWVAEIPAFQHLNYLHNQIDVNQLALAERGIFEYGTDVTYAKGALVWREADGFIYIALVANPTSAPPSIQWARSCVQLSRQEFEALIADWNAHILNKENPHNVTATQAGAVPITGGTYTGLVTHSTIQFGGTSGLSHFISDTDGSSWTYNGVKTFNISPEGVPRSFFAGAWWNFLYEENFNTIKKDVTPLFVLPLADFHLPLTYNLHPKDSAESIYPDYTRAGSLSYTNKLNQTVSAATDVPPFGRRGLVLSKKDVLLTGLSLPTDKVFSVGFNMHRMSGTSISTSTPFLVAGVLKVLFTGTNVQVSYNGGIKLDILDQATATTKVVVRSSSTAVDLFINGVLVGTGEAISTIPASTVVNIGDTTDTATNAEMTNFKFWYHKLSAEQISNF